MTSSLTPPISATDEEPYLPVEDVAERLGVPLGILVRRLEAGDVPARRTSGPDGVRYSLRLSDLGIEQDPVEAEPEVHPPVAAREHVAVAEVTGVAAPRGIAEATKEIVAEIRAEIRAEDVETAPPPRPRPIRVEPPRASLREQEEADERIPARAPELSIFKGFEERGPRAEVANMSLDAREVVAGLLDRWERTLEQRIYAEQRQRFENELIGRQNHVKHLQMELQTSRAEHAAVQAEKDRQLAEKERALADRERELAQLRANPPKRRGWLFFR